MLSMMMMMMMMTMTLTDIHKVSRHLSRAFIKLKTLSEACLWGLRIDSSLTRLQWRVFLHPIYVNLLVFQTVLQADASL
ncbi:hypothetical protein CRM22_005290 [Opisthorchis felineus]|uniref:Uncharacterized protein n=1 Tax=Opisthorchis felineus TaxID=147828 RepID=A0A4S2LRR1_OPIFE|nr:hypothetical protein CRM22_005290 [Opisthorchis felineus]